MEYLDIVDEFDNPLGFYEEKTKAHQMLYFHRTAHIWLINKDKKVIIQKRSLQKETCPGMWDISSAGHIRTGETILEGAKRELYEELGIQKEDNDFIYIGKIKYDSTHTKEYCYVFVVYDDRDLDEYKFMDNEVTAIKRVSYKSLPQIRNIVNHRQEFKMLNSFINSCKLIQDSEHLYHLKNNPETDRPSLYLIKGSKYNVQIDAGNSSSHALMFELTLKFADFDLPKYTIISHWHWDHTFGMHALKNKTIASKLTNEILDIWSKYKWTKKEMDHRLKDGIEMQFCHDNILKEYYDLSLIKVIRADEAINTKKTLDLGDIQVELIPLATTHSLDSLLVYIPNDKALIVQDADWIDPYVSYEYEETSLRKMIKDFEDIDYAYQYFGHCRRESKTQVMKRLNKELKKICVR